MKGCRFREILSSGACLVDDGNGRQVPACRATLRERDGAFERRLVSLVLSRPEHYLSVYQSGCNLSCGKCHSDHTTPRINVAIIALRAACKRSST